MYKLCLNPVKSACCKNLKDASENWQTEDDVAIRKLTLLLVVGVVSVLPATRIPLQTSHTETPTHIEPRTIRLTW